jgi:hypothetical protein
MIATACGDDSGGTSGSAGRAGNGGGGGGAGRAGSPAGGSVSGSRAQAGEGGGADDTGLGGIGASDSGGEAGAESASDGGAGGAAAAAGAATGGAGQAGAPVDVAGQAGEASEGGAPGDVQQIQIVAAETAFVDYGSLHITFDADVDASTVTAMLSPQVPSKLAVSAVQQSGSNSVDVTLSYYHLPRDYQLEVSGQLAGGAAFVAATTLPGLDNGARLAFLSKTADVARFQDWADAPDGATTSRDAADGVCQAEAEAAGFQGTFVAWLSDQGEYDAGCRAFGLNGTVADECEQLSMPVDDAPFLSASGLPIVNGATGIIAAAWKTPIPFHADGSVATSNVWMWTGSAVGAKASGYDCDGWTRKTHDQPLASGSIVPSAYLPAYDGGMYCDQPGKLLCLQVAGKFFGPSTLHLGTGKRAFVSTGKLSGAMSFGDEVGAAAADALCQSEAAAEAYDNADTFHAYLSTSTDDAACRVLGLSGKVAVHCGLPALPIEPVWHRPDGYPVGNATALVDYQLSAPMMMDVDETPIDEWMWTGTNPSGTAGNICADWQGAGQGTAGYARATTNGWTQYTFASCSNSYRLYCFEG